MDKPLNFQFTSESGCAGHPDNLCDQISDACVDAVLAQDPNGRVAIETMAGNNHFVLMGEIGTFAKVDFEKVAREQIRKLGYTDPTQNFTHRSPATIIIHEQSPEIAIGVKAKGAGDQGIMFGYACTETPHFMPMPITLAHSLAQNIDILRENGKLPYLKPDGKTQVTVEYKNGKPYKVTNVVVAVPHHKKVSLKDVRKDIFTEVIVPVLGEYGLTVDSSQVIVNGTGVWHKSGPAADTGLTGRKIVVDTYGAATSIGGGAMSGKDPTKVDRSGAYAARYIAKNIVANKLADKAEVRLAWAIRQKRPLAKEIR